MRLKNGMNAEEIEKELLNNSIKKNEDREMLCNLNYNENLNLSTKDILDKKNILLSAGMVQDYIENNASIIHIIKQDGENIINDLKNISFEDEKFDSKKTERFFLYTNREVENDRLLKEIEISFKDDSEEYNYFIDCSLFLNIIYYKNIAIGYILEDDKKYFCLFIEDDYKIIVFNDNDFDNLIDLIIQLN